MNTIDQDAPEAQLAEVVQLRPNPGSNRPAPLANVPVTQHGMRRALSGSAARRVTERDHAALLDEIRVAFGMSGRKDTAGPVLRWRTSEKARHVRVQISPIGNRTRVLVTEHHGAFVRENFRSIVGAAAATAIAGSGVLVAMGLGPFAVVGYAGVVLASGAAIAQVVSDRAVRARTRQLGQLVDTLQVRLTA